MTSGNGSGALLLVCLKFYLTTCMVILGRLGTCNRAHSCRLYSAAPLGDRWYNDPTSYPTQSHYHDTAITSPCQVLVLSNTGLSNDKYKIYKSLV